MDDEERDRKLFRNSVQFLCNVSQLNLENSPALISLISTKRRLLETRKKLIMENRYIENNIKCPRCLIEYAKGPVSYKVVPNKKTKMKTKIIKKLKNNKPLSHFESEYMKSLKNELDNKLIVVCGFCQKEKQVNMKKPMLHKPKTNVPSNKQVLKNKIKKDKYCGLNQEAVQAVSKKNPLDTSTFLALNNSDIPKPVNLVNINEERVFNSSDVIVIEDTPKKKLQMSMKRPAEEPIQPNEVEVKKKKKNAKKLGDFLKQKPKENASSKLKHFLKSL